LKRVLDLSATSVDFLSIMPTYSDDEDPNPEPGETSMGMCIE